MRCAICDDRPLSTTHQLPRPSSSEQHPLTHRSLDSIEYSQWRSYSWVIPMLLDGQRIRYLSGKCLRTRTTTPLWQKCKYKDTPEQPWNKWWINSISHSSRMPLLLPPLLSFSVPVKMTLGMAFLWKGLFAPWISCWRTWPYHHHRHYPITTMINPNVRVIWLFWVRSSNRGSMMIQIRRSNTRDWARGCSGDAWSVQM